MPLYLVRWPELSASLVRADDEEQLLFILDQVANSEGCEWSVYEGPLFINFLLPAKWSIQDKNADGPATPDRIIIDDLNLMSGKPVTETMQLSFSDSDDGYDAARSILRTAFPSVHKATEKLIQNCDDYDELERGIPEAELRNALHAELTRLLKASWRRAQIARKTDVVSELAQDMDIPVALSRTYFEAARNRRKSDDEPEQ